MYRYYVLDDNAQILHVLPTLGPTQIIQAVNFVENHFSCAFLQKLVQFNMRKSLIDSSNGLLGILDSEF